MPRIRTIKPQFWLDENLGKLPRDARLLYIGLWNLSDDTGVFEWRPMRIKVQLFPYDLDITESTIQEWLDLLITSGDVQQFSTNRNSFGFIPSFLKHQEIKKPSQWKYAEVPHELPTGSPRVPHELPTGSPREKEKEKESIKKNTKKKKGKYSHLVEQ